MATPRATKTDIAGRVIEMQATPDFTNDTAFDSFLIIKENGCDNHTLTLVLKMHMNQVAPLSVRLPVVGNLTFPFADFDGTLFAIKPWTAGEFAAFRRSFLQQCANWNDKFWLIPPAGFSGLDYKLGGRTVRPNIYCHLFISVLGSAAGAASEDRHRQSRQKGSGTPAGQARVRAKRERLSLGLRNVRLSRREAGPSSFQG